MFTKKNNLKEIKFFLLNYFLRNSNNHLQEYSNIFRANNKPKTQRLHQQTLNNLYG